MKEHKRKICIWSDGTWCFKDDIEDFSWMSDDYVEQEVAHNVTEEDIEKMLNY